MFPVGVAFIAFPAQSVSDFSPADLANYLKLIASNAGYPGRIACKDVDVAMQLKKDGISIDARSPVAWASNMGQVKTYAEENKFIICSNPELLSMGASLAIFREHGKPTLILSGKNAKSSGVQLTDNLMKVVRIL